jgi:hypothetical protein
VDRANGEKRGRREHDKDRKGRKKHKILKKGE